MQYYDFIHLVKNKRYGLTFLESDNYSKITKSIKINILLHFFINFEENFCLEN